MGKINSKVKSKNGELEIVHILKDRGYKNSRRSCQFNGKAEEGQADVVGLDGFHIEVKRVEHLNIYEAIEQAVRDNGDSLDTPVVFHRKNNKKWLCTLRLDDFLDIIKEK